MTTTELDLTADIIDVRDIIARIEELEDAISAYAEKMTDWQDNADNTEELAKLQALLDDLEGLGGDEQWRGNWYPVTLIRDSYFKDYMDEMLEDCGDLPKDLPCYLSITVDYKALQMDYTSISIDDVTYWTR
jgi:hypothetical protein